MLQGHEFFSQLFLIKWIPTDSLRARHDAIVVTKEKKFFLQCWWAKLKRYLSKLISYLNVQVGKFIASFLRLNFLVRIKIRIITIIDGYIERWFSQRNYIRTNETHPIEIYIFNKLNKGLILRHGRHEIEYPRLR